MFFRYNFCLMVSIIPIKILIITIILYQIKAQQQNHTTYFSIAQQNITIKLYSLIDSGTPTTKYIIEGQQFQQHSPLQLLKVSPLAHKPQSEYLHAIFQESTVLYGAIITLDLHFYYSNYNHNVLLCNLRLPFAIYQKIIIINQTQILVVGPRFLTKINYQEKQNISQSCKATRFDLNLSSQLKRCSRFGGFACFSMNQIIIPYHNKDEMPPIVIKVNNTNIVGISYNQDDKFMEIFSNSSYLNKYQVDENYSLKLLKSQRIFDMESIFMEKRDLIYYIICNNTVNILKDYEYNKQILNKIYSPIGYTISDLEISINGNYLTMLYLGARIHQIVLFQTKQQSFKNIYVYNTIVKADKVFFLNDGFQVFFSNQTHYWLCSLNPQYITISHTQYNRSLLIKSVLTPTITKTFVVYIEPKQENQVIIIDALPTQSEHDYDSLRYFELDKIIIGSKIACYKLELFSYEEHTRANFQLKGTVLTSQIFEVITIYINEPFISIVQQTSNSFLRLVSVSHNTIYTQRCSLSGSVFVCNFLQRKIISENQLDNFKLGNKSYAIFQNNHSSNALFQQIIDVKTQQCISFTLIKSKKTIKYKLDPQQVMCAYKNYPKSILICPTYIKFFSIKGAQIKIRKLPNKMKSIKFAFLKDYIFILGNDTTLQKYSVLSSQPKLEFTLQLNTTSNIEQYYVLDKYLLLQYDQSYKIFDCSKTKINILMAEQQGKLLSKPIFLGEYIGFMLNSYKFMGVFQLSPSISFGKMAPLPYYNKVKGLLRISAFQEQCQGQPAAKTEGITWVNFESLQITIATLKAKVFNVPYSTSQDIYKQLYNDMFYGAIVSYYLSDDFQKQLRLQNYVNSRVCPQLIHGKTLIQSVFKVSKNVETIYTLSYYFEDKTIVQYIKLGSQQAVLEYFDLGNKSLQNCEQYSDQFGSVLFCQQFVGFLNKGSPAVLIDFSLTKHRFGVKIGQRIELRLFVLESNLIKNQTTTIVYILDRLDKRIYKQSTRTYEGIGISISVTENAIAILLGKSLCLQFPDNTLSCIQTQNFLYNNFQNTEDYLQVQIYKVSPQANEINFLLISSTANNIHLDVKSTKNSSTNFLWNISSVYGGYRGFYCNDLKYVKLQPQTQNLQYFALSYQDQFNSNLLGFYNFQTRYISKGIIGNIVQAIPYNSSTSVFFESNNGYMDKKCFVYNKTLYLVLNYEEPPAVTYLVLHAYNDLTDKIYHIKLLFQATNPNYLGMYLGFGVIILLFFVLIFINRILPKIYKKNKSLKYGNSIHKGFLSSQNIQAKESSENIKQQNKNS